MKAKCPECDCEFETGGGMGPDDMDADDMATSEAVPYENMGGEVLALAERPSDLQGLPRGISALEMADMGLDPVPPGSDVGRAARFAGVANALRSRRPTLTTDELGQQAQTYASDEQITAQGRRSLAPSDNTLSAMMTRALQSGAATRQPIIAVDENGQETATYATPEQIRARGWTIRGAQGGSELSRALRSR